MIGGLSESEDTENSGLVHRFFSFFSKNQKIEQKNSNEVISNSPLQQKSIEPDAIQMEKTNLYEVPLFLVYPGSKFEKGSEEFLDHLYNNSSDSVSPSSCPSSPSTPLYACVDTTLHSSSYPSKSDFSPSKLSMIDVNGNLTNVLKMNPHLLDPSVSSSSNSVAPSVSQIKPNIASILRVARGNRTPPSPLMLPASLLSRLPALPSRSISSPPINNTTSPSSYLSSTSSSSTTDFKSPYLPYTVASPYYPYHTNSSAEKHSHHCNRSPASGKRDTGSLGDFAKAIYYNSYNTIGMETILGSGCGSRFGKVGYSMIDENKKRTKGDERKRMRTNFGDSEKGDGSECYISPWSYLGKQLSPPSSSSSTSSSSFSSSSSPSSSCSSTSSSSTTFSSSSTATLTTSTAFSSSNRSSISPTPCIRKVEEAKDDGKTAGKERSTASFAIVPFLSTSVSPPVTSATSTSAVSTPAIATTEKSEKQEEKHEEEEVRKGLSGSFSFNFAFSMGMGMAGTSPCPLNKESRAGRKFRPRKNKTKKNESGETLDEPFSSSATSIPSSESSSSSTPSSSCVLFPALTHARSILSACLLVVSLLVSLCLFALWWVCSAALAVLCAIFRTTRRVVYLVFYCRWWGVEKSQGCYSSSTTSAATSSVSVSVSRSESTSTGVSISTPISNSYTDLDKENASSWSLLLFTPFTTIFTLVSAFLDSHRALLLAIPLSVTIVCLVARQLTSSGIKLH